MAAVEIREAKLNLDELVERALSGERIVLMRDGEPLVRLVPVNPETPPR
jgi:prevent-host-death family protein